MYASACVHHVHAGTCMSRARVSCTHVCTCRAPTCMCVMQTRAHVSCMCARACGVHACHVHSCTVSVCVVSTHVCTCMRVENLTPGGGRHTGVRSRGTGRAKGPRDFWGSPRRGAPAQSPCSLPPKIPLKKIKSFHRTLGVRPTRPCRGGPWVWTSFG